MISLIALWFVSNVVTDPPVAVVVNTDRLPAIKEAVWPRDWDTRSGSFRDLELATVPEGQFAFDRRLFGIAEVEGFTTAIKESMSAPQGVVTLGKLSVDTRAQMLAYLGSMSAGSPGPFTSAAPEFKNLAFATQPCLTLTFSDGNQDFEVTVPAALLNPKLAVEIAFDFDAEELKRASSIPPKARPSSDPSILFAEQVSPLSRAKLGVSALVHMRDILIEATAARDATVTEWLQRFSAQVEEAFPGIGNDVLGVGVSRLPPPLQRLLQSGMAPGTPMHLRGNSEAWSQLRLKGARSGVGLAIVGKNKETGAVQAQFLPGR